MQLGFWLLIGLWAATWLWFVVMPQKSLALARGDTELQRRLLELIVNTPLATGAKIHARYILAGNYQVARRYSCAEALYWSILRDNEGVILPGFESLVRQNLADAIEALGRREDAQTQRDRAVEVLRRGGGTIVDFQAQGKLFDREHLYDEAVAAYKQALAAYPPPNKTVAATLMIHLVLSSNNAGRPADTVRWAESLIGLDPHGPHAGRAQRMAAVGCTKLGRSDDAERHLRSAIERASSPKDRADLLAQLAGCVFRRGNLDEAERMACDAEAMAPRTQVLPWKIIGRIERARGRIEEAIQALEHCSDISISHVPTQNRRVTAVIQRDLATLHAELGRGDVALSLICEAEIELSGDRQQEMLLDAAAALVHAFRKEPDIARNRIASALDARTILPEDRGNQQAVLYSLSRAALLIDEPERAESFLNAFLELEPEPVSRAFAYYHLAECRRQAGDIAMANDLNIKAASTRFGSRWEFLARDRLAAEGAPGS